MVLRAASDATQTAATHLTEALARGTPDAATVQGSVTPGHGCGSNACAATDDVAARCLRAAAARFEAACLALPAVALDNTLFAV